MVLLLTVLAALRLLFFWWENPLRAWPRSRL